MLRDVETWVWFFNNANLGSSQTEVEQHPFNENREIHFVTDHRRMPMDDEYGSDPLIIHLTGKYNVEHLVMFKRTRVSLTHVIFKMFRDNGELFSVYGEIKINDGLSRPLGMDKPRSLVPSGNIDNDFAETFLKKFDRFKVADTYRPLSKKFRGARELLVESEIEDMLMMRKLTFT